MSNSDAGKIVAFVHAKATSERVPGKNLRPLGDCPLFVHAVRAAQKASRVAEVVVDSDGDEILSIAEGLGVSTLRRPATLATNNATGDDLAYWQASNRPGSKVIVQVVPTSPFIRSATIDAAITILEQLQVDSVVGIRAEPLYCWQDNRPVYRLNGRLPNSTDLPCIIWETTGLYVVRTRFALQARQRINVDSAAFCRLSKLESVDINTLEDFEFAEIVWRGMNTEQVAQ